jgi:hypothetical protein
VSRCCYGGCISEFGWMGAANHVPAGTSCLAREATIKPQGSGILGSFRASGTPEGQENGKVSRLLLSGLIQDRACGGSMDGRTSRKNRRRKNGSPVGTAHYVCAASIIQGKPVCRPIQFLQSGMDDLVSDRPGRLRDERRELEGRLRELEPVPARVIEPEAVVG